MIRNIALPFPDRQESAACRHGGFLFLCILVFCSLSATPAAAQTDTTIGAFVAEAFPGTTPEANTLWFTPELKTAARKAAGFSPDLLRLRYWRHADRTAWVIDRIGKEEPITFGVIVERDAIVALKVLAYRESRGHEIRSPRWLAQFTDARADRQGLSRRVDGIAGATLSVRAGIDVARLALFCHQHLLQKRTDHP